MALADYVAPSHEFKLTGGTFSVTGVSLVPLGELIRNRLGDMEQLFQLTDDVLGGKMSFDEGDLERVALILAEQLPEFVAYLIALAAGEGDNEAAVKAARNLAFPVQVEVLKTIGTLTFEEVGGVGKFIESLKGMLGNMGMVRQAIPALP